MFSFDFAMQMVSVASYFAILVFTLIFICEEKKRIAELNVVNARCGHVRIPKRVIIGDVIFGILVTYALFGGAGYVIQVFGVSFPLIAEANFIVALCISLFVIASATGATGCENLIKLQKPFLYIPLLLVASLATTCLCWNLMNVCNLLN